MENLIAIDDTNFSITDEGADEKFIAMELIAEFLLLSMYREYDLILLSYS